MDVFHLRTTTDVARAFVCRGCGTRAATTYRMEGAKKKVFCTEECGRRYRRDKVTLPQAIAIVWEYVRKNNAERQQTDGRVLDGPADDEGGHDDGCGHTDGTPGEEGPLDAAQVAE